MAAKFCPCCDKPVTVAKDRMTCQGCGADLLHKRPARTADALCHFGECGAARCTGCGVQI